MVITSTESASIPQGFLDGFEECSYRHWNRNLSLHAPRRRPRPYPLCWALQPATRGSWCTLSELHRHHPHRFGGRGKTRLCTLHVNWGTYYSEIILFACTADLLPLGCIISCP